LVTGSRSTRRSPINLLFLLFLLLFLFACAVGMSEAPEGEDTGDDLPAAFRAMTKLVDARPGTNGHTAEGARHERERRP